MRLTMNRSDRLFAACLPAAALAAALYFLVWSPAAGHARAVREDVARMGDPEDLRAERSVLEARLAEARRAAPAGAQAAGEAGDGARPPVAEREAGVRAALRDAGVEVVQARPDAPGRGGVPRVWTYAARAEYDEMRAALRTLAGAEHPGVVVESVSLSAPAETGPELFWSVRVAP